MYSVCMPAFVASNAEVEDVRHKIRMTWTEHAVGSKVPVIVLAMNDEQQKLVKDMDMDNIIVFNAPKLHHLIAHEVMNRISMKAGIDKVLIVDDDFFAYQGFAAWLDSTIKEDRKVLYVASRRMWFTTFKNRPVVSKIVEFVDPETKHIQKGVKAWEALDGWPNVSYVLWTREGFLIHADDMRKSVEDYKDQYPDGMYNRHMLSGIDVLTLSRLVEQEGMIVKRVTNHFHNTFREDAPPDAVNYSTCVKEGHKALEETPMTMVHETKNTQYVFDEWAKVDQYVDEVLANNEDAFRRLVEHSSNENN